MAMAQDNSDNSRTDYRLVFGIALKIPPDHPDVLMLKFKTKHGPFRFGLSQDMAEKIAGQISDHAKLIRPQRQTYPE
jgi:hypothetical protein